MLRNLALFSLLLTALCLIATPASASVYNTWYVATNGSDSYTGLSATYTSGSTGPFLDIAKALGVSGDGDIIIVEPGTYPAANNTGLDFYGADRTLESAAGAADTIIDCGGSAQFLSLENGETSASLLDGFTIENGSAANGGAISIGLGGSSTSATIKDCVFSGNSATGSGGAIDIAASQPIISDCIFVDNSAGGSGGAINFGSSGLSINISIDNCVFFGNTSGGGGGTYGQAVTAIPSGAALTLDSCTFSGNNSPGNNYAAVAAVDGATATIKNCILYGDDEEADTTPNETSGSITFSYSDIAGGDMENGDLTSDPLFVNQNGGYLRLQPGSPEIGAGSTTLTTDLDGFGRPASPTMGAYEPHTFYVATNGNDSYDGTSATIIGGTAGPLLDIETAITKSGTDDTIIVEPGTYPALNNTSLDFGGVDRILESSSGAANTIVNCGGSAVFMTLENGETNASIIEGLTIENGSHANGGAIVLGPISGGSSASPSIEDCVFSGNNAAGSGGAITIDDSEPMIARCTFSNNSAADNGGAITVASTTINVSLDVTNCVFFGNTSSGDGGVYGQAVSVILSPTTVTLDGCTFSGNNSPGNNYAAVGAVNGGIVTIKNCILYGDDEETDTTPLETNIFGAGSITVSYSDIAAGDTANHDITTDPLFVDQATGNLMLQAGSPAIGAGMTALATDIDGEPREVPSTMGAYDPPLTITITPSSLPLATIGTSYSQTLTATGGVSPYAYAVAAGGLPAGISLTGGGAIVGIPTEAGTFPITVAAADSETLTGRQAYTLTVGAPTITLAPATLPAATVGAAYSQAVTVGGGTAPYADLVTAGALPSGVTLIGGALIGTPTAGGSFTFTITAIDSSTGAGAPFTGSVSYTLTVNPAVIVVAPATLQSGTVAAAYSQLLTASGGTAPYTFAVTTGALPGGMSLTSGGLISGTPTEGGVFNIFVTVTDSSAGSGPYATVQSYWLTVGAPTISPAPGPLPAGTVGAAYAATLTASGGTAPYSFTLTAGALPTGLNLSSRGAIAGIPTAGGTFNFTVTATDSTSGTGPFTASLAYTVVIYPPTITINTLSYPLATIGVPYSFTFVGSGGTAPLTFAVAAGHLPPGLTLTSAGLLSGTPTTGGSFYFTIAATDSSTGTGAPYSGSRSYGLAVEPAAIVVLPPSLPTPTDGVAYTANISASGGTAPYAFAITSGAVPGLTLSPGGVLSGTPAASGTFDFTIAATDSSGGTGPYTGFMAYALHVNAQQFPAGLAMISVPSDYAGQSLESVLGYASPTLAVWDAAAGTYDVTPTPSANELQVGRGYWVRFPAVETIDNLGTPTPTNTPFTIALHTGWNMIGDPFLIGEPVTGLSVQAQGVTPAPFNAAVNSGLVESPVFAYSGGSYEAATALSPYQGYWIEVSQDCTLIVPAP